MTPLSGRPLGKKPLREIIKEGKNVVAFSPKATPPNAEDRLRLRMDGSKVLPFKQKKPPQTLAGRPNRPAPTETIAMLLKQLRDGEAAYMKSKNNPKYPKTPIDEAKKTPKPPLGHETLKAALKASLKVTPKKEK